MKVQKMKPRIYIDTSVIAGYFDEEFEVDTKNILNGFFEKTSLFISLKSVKRNYHWLQPRLEN
jgi:hypothetical protein